jgi:transposase-like protein
MYSYEDRVRAVELFIKLGKRVRATIRQLGYPTKNALKGWHQEYEQRLDLPVGYAGRDPKYSQAQKEAAVKHYLTHDRCIAATIRVLGYPGRGTLTAWVCKALPEIRKPSLGKQVVQAIPRHSSKLESSVFAVDKKVRGLSGIPCVGPKWDKRSLTMARRNHSTWAAYDDGYLNRSGSWRCISRRFLSSSTPSLVKAMMASSPIP